MSDRTTPSIYQRDYAWLEFILVVGVGIVGSAALTYTFPERAYSLILCIPLMLGISVRRIIVAKRADRDAESLEVFAEDIYLLGYLLTLAALLGLTPKLTADDSHLINIAGLKLATTVLGLSLMMGFKQIARRWDAQKALKQASEFEKQQRLLSDAAARLNGAADELATKMVDILARFDSKGLSNVVEWSRQMVTAFKAATEVLEQMPTAIKSGKEQLEYLRDAVKKSQSAIEELTGSVRIGTIPATGQLTTALNQASQLTNQFGIIVAAINPTTTQTNNALSALGKNAASDASQLEDLATNLKDVVGELGKVLRALKKVAEIQIEGTNSPIIRLTGALEANALDTSVTHGRLDAIQAELERATNATEALGQVLKAQAQPPLVQPGRPLAGPQRVVLYRPPENPLGAIKQSDAHLAENEAAGFGSKTAGRNQWVSSSESIQSNTKAEELRKEDTATTARQKRNLWNLYGILKS